MKRCDEEFTQQKSATETSQRNFFLLIKKFRKSALGNFVLGSNKWVTRDEQKNYIYFFFLIFQKQWYLDITNSKTLNCWALNLEFYTDLTYYCSTSNNEGNHAYTYSVPGSTQR